MLVSRSAYYAWLKRPVTVISATTLNLYRRLKTLFKESRGSLGNQSADNLLNQNFNPVVPNQVRADDVTYLKTEEGWMYPAIVMDLYSRRIVGWHISKRMTTGLVNKALMKAYNLRQTPRGLVFHSDRGSQYTSKRYQKLLQSYGMRSSMGDVGACWDNAYVERFFGSLSMIGCLKCLRRPGNI